MPRPRPPRNRRGEFVNYAGDVRAAPLRWELPTTEYDVQRAVDRARDEGARVRVVGAGHSWSAAAAPDDIALSLDRLAGPVRIDRDRRAVTVPGGMRLRDLSAHLATRDLALPIVGSIQAQSVAGAIATGTHGSSLTHGNLSSLVLAMRLVGADGRVHVVEPGDERLLGCRVHLGALGVVTAVTLQVAAASYLEQSIEQVPVGDVPARLPDIATSAEYVKVWWLPHASTAQVVRYARVPSPARPSRASARRRWVDERVLHRTAFPLMVAVQHRRPTMTAALNERMSRSYLGPPTQVGPGPLMLNTPMPLRHRETEAAVPLATAGDAVAAILGLFRDGRPAANFPLEIRFVRGDDTWLSPAYGADTCQVGAYSTAGPDCDDYFERFWAAVAPYDARPHWGKELTQTAADLAPCYPQWQRFAALRDELDPDRLFANAWARQVLGD